MMTHVCVITCLPKHMVADGCGPCSAVVTWELEKNKKLLPTKTIIFTTLMQAYKAMDCISAFLLVLISTCFLFIYCAKSVSVTVVENVLLELTVSLQWNRTEQNRTTPEKKVISNVQFHLPYAKVCFMTLMEIFKSESKKTRFQTDSSFIMQSKYAYYTQVSNICNFLHKSDVMFLLL